MAPAAGVALIAVSLAAVAVAVWGVRPRATTALTVAVLAIAGVGLGLGGLMFMQDVDAASWFVAPVVMAVLTIAHTMALFARGGPLRT